MYCDNYLDGGYHVPHAHISLAACLDLSSYSTNVSAPLEAFFCLNLSCTWRRFSVISPMLTKERKTRQKGCCIVKFLVEILMFRITEGMVLDFVQLLERVSIQSCRAAKQDDASGNLRVGSIANYAFVYPNFMINRYEVGFFIVNVKFWGEAEFILRMHHICDACM